MEHEKLGELVQDMKLEGNEISPEILAHTSPLFLEHNILMGEYRWPNA
jgi:hypothetical protein